MRNELNSLNCFSQKPQTVFTDTLSSTALYFTLCAAAPPAGRRQCGRFTWQYKVRRDPTWFRKYLDPNSSVGKTTLKASNWKKSNFSKPSTATYKLVIFTQM